MIFTNIYTRTKPHLFKHSGRWWLLRPWSHGADEVYLSLRWWYYTYTGQRITP